MEVRDSGWEMGGWDQKIEGRTKGGGTGERGMETGMES